MTTPAVSAPERIATAVCVLACGWLGYLLAASLPATGVVVAGIVVLAVGGAITQTQQRTLGLTVAGAGAALGAVAVPAATDRPLEQGAWWVTLVAGSMLAIGSVRGRFAAGVLGAGASLLLLVAWVAAVRFLPVEVAAAVVGVASALVLGLLARCAVAAAGLTRLSTAERTALGSADWAPAIVVTAGSTALAAVVLTQLGSVPAIVLSGLLAIVLLLRARVTTPVAAACWVAAAGALVVVVSAASMGWVYGVSIATVVALGALIRIGIRPSWSIVDGARRVADLLELAVVIALVPAGVVVAVLA